MLETEAVVRHDAELEIRAGRARTAVWAMERIVKRDDKLAENFAVFGDAYRGLGPLTPVPAPQELTEKGKDKARKMISKMTPQEYEAALLKAPGGQQTLASNQQLAENNYKKALSISPDLPEPYRGLGLLYEEEHRGEESEAAYRKYLKLSPSAADSTPNSEATGLAGKRDGDPAATGRKQMTTRKMQTDSWWLRMMKRKALFQAAVILVVCAAPSTLPAQFVHQDVRSGKKAVTKILILPPEATLMKSGMKGAEPLVAESETMGAGLESVIGQALTDRGCNVLPNAFSPSALGQDAALKYTVSDLQVRYDKLQTLLKKKPKGVRTGRFSLGDEVANLGAGADADVLVFVRANGYLPTAGLKTFVVVTGMGITRSFAQLSISIVDAQTGTILYFVQPKVYGNFVGKPDTMKEPIEQSLSDLVVTRTSPKK